ncbi:MAG: hypothetical protein H8E86_01530 [Planctomycetes bacterium]|nr:hypothetical protein [Planctomycetota bacterium]
MYLCGCASNPWAYNAAPGAGPMGAEAAQKPTILLTTFTTGSSVDARWTDVGQSMQKAFARALVKSGKFDVVYNRATAQKARTAFQIEAEVTDFLHTSDAPETVRRLSWFTQANDAIVAMDVTATELQSGRVVFSDQISAVVSAGDDAVDAYGALEFGSYLYWSTPLGEASSEVITESVAKLTNLRGSTPGTVTITEFIDGQREVTLEDGDLLADGGIYYVGSPDTVTGEFVAVDDDLGRPLRIRVEHHFFGQSTGWLLSEPADFETLVGGTLSKAELPTQLSAEYINP